MVKKEKTLAIIKPDAVGKKVAGEIISMIENSGLEIKSIKMATLDTSSAAGFYAVHNGKSFYDGLIEFMVSGPCIILVLEGENAVEIWRGLMGATDPQQAPQGTVRRKYGTDVRRNSCHGSDSAENAQNEISFFFPGIELLK